MMFILIAFVAVQLAFVTTTSEGYKQIKLWTDYHKSIGVETFYLFVDGQVRIPSHFVKVTIYLLSQIIEQKCQCVLATATAAAAGALCCI